MQYASERVGILSFTTLLNHVLGFFFNFFCFIKEVHHAARLERYRKARASDRR